MRGQLRIKGEAQVKGRWSSLANTCGLGKFFSPSHRLTGAKKRQSGLALRADWEH
jgi:hypothetical protein